MTDSRAIVRPLHARAPCATTQEVVHRDGRPVPAVFELESPRFLGDEDIAFARYTDPKFFEREMQQMWTRTWQWACREEHIPEPGAYSVYEIGRHSIIIVRDVDSSIKAYINSCLHRGTKLRPSGSEGNLAELRCPFHGWTWALDGFLKCIPCAWDLPHVQKRDFSLPQVRVGMWGGFVFINLDPNAPDLEDYIDPIPEDFARFDMANRYVALHIQKELYANWKASIEAFMENYHTQETHPQLMHANHDEGTQYDIFTDHVSRFFTAFGVASPHLPRSLSEQEILDSILIGDQAHRDKKIRIGEGETARIVLARLMRDALSESYQADLSRYADTEIIDLAQYSIFPNMILYPQLSLPVVYRFRPIGEDVNRCLFELFLLPPLPDSGKRPEPAAPILVTEHESLTKVPGLDPALGHVFDQDTGNLRSQQEGFRAARKAGQTLLNYQEVRIRQLHRTLDQYLE